MNQKANWPEIAEADRRFMLAAIAYCEAIDIYDRSSTPLNLRKMTVARRELRDAFREMHDV